MIDVPALFLEHNQSLFRYLIRLTGGDEAAATDAVQHAFLKLLETTDEILEPKAWIYKVATHAIHDWTGTERRRRTLMSHHPEDAPRPASEDAPDRILEREERVRTVRQALARLTDKERTVLLMREDGFKHKEIAEAVGTTTGSVGTMIARALERLTTLLALDAGELS